MDAFIKWLWGIASRVYYIFSTIYSTVVDVVMHAWAWVNNKASEAYQSAISWAQSRINDIRAWANSQIDYIRSVVNNVKSGIWNDVVSWVNDKITDVRVSIALVRQLFDRVPDLAKEWGKYFADQVREYARLGLQELVSNINRVVDSNSWLSAIKSNLLYVTSPDFLSKIKTLLDTGFNNLSTFISDPVGFAVASIFPIFVDIFCYAIGYGLGTINETLPPIPAWGANNSNNGGSGTDIPSTGQISAPCSPLYVSGYTYTPNTGHYGVDFGIGMGQAIYAAHNGKVILVQSGSSGYGNNIIIESDKLWSRYAHLQSFNVTAGQTVSAGAKIAAGDSTGNSTGAHLHFELKINGNFVNPVSYL